jgi:hypothetical protein
MSIRSANRAASGTRPLSTQRAQSIFLILLCGVAAAATLFVARRGRDLHTGVSVDLRQENLLRDVRLADGVSSITFIRFLADGGVIRAQQPLVVGVVCVRSPNCPARYKAAVEDLFASAKSRSSEGVGTLVTRSDRIEEVTPWDRARALRPIDTPTEAMLLTGRITGTILWDDNKRAFRVTHVLKERCWADRSRGWTTTIVVLVDREGGVDRGRPPTDRGGFGPSDCQRLAAP